MTGKDRILWLTLKWAGSILGFGFLALLSEGFGAIAGVLWSVIAGLLFSAAIGYGLLKGSQLMRLGVLLTSTVGLVGGALGCVQSLGLSVYAFNFSYFVLAIIAGASAYMNLSNLRVLTHPDVRRLFR